MIKTRQKPTPTQTHICPRCGYDQSGITQTWTTQCPLKGTCSECGLTFQWSHILNPSNITYPWFTEHAPRKRTILRRTIPTFMRLLIPSIYWKHLQMEVPRSRSKHLISILMFSAILWITNALTILGVNLYGVIKQLNRFAQQKSTTTDPQQLQAILATEQSLKNYKNWEPLLIEIFLVPFVNSKIFFGILNDVVSLTLGLSGLSCAWFLMFCLFPTTRKKSKIRITHLFNAFVVSTTFIWILVPIAKLVDGVHYLVVVHGWGPGYSLVNINVFLSILGIIWVSWFWISAIRSSWKMGVKWWEFILLLLASPIGGFIGALFIYIFNNIVDANTILIDFIFTL